MIYENAKLVYKVFCSMTIKISFLRLYFKPKAYGLFPTWHISTALQDCVLGQIPKICAFSKS
jgi:hypothetical protein